MALDHLKTDSSANKPNTRLVFLRRSWFIVVLFSLIVLTIETIEHIQSQGGLLTSHFLTEVLIYGGIIPFVGFLLLRILFRAVSERDQVVSEIDQHIGLSHSLVGTSHIGELSQNIAQIPSTIFPSVRSNLYLADPEHGQFDLAASYDLEGAAAKSPVQAFRTLEDCQLCLSNQTIMPNQVVVCPRTEYSLDPDHTKTLCLPLVYKEALTAKLHIEVPHDLVLDSRQTRSLNLLAPEMALALETTRNQQTAANQFEAAVLERKQIARNLHDTLGQNISLLRMKLEQLNSDDSLVGIAEVRSDIHQMLGLVDQAYDQVRNTLDELKPTKFPGLIQELEMQATEVEKRSNLEITVISEGKPTMLDSRIQQEIYCICREIYNNIEKHAQASMVSTHILWSETHLKIMIEDNGIGFDPTERKKTSDGYTHYGLVIIKESIQDMNGVFDLVSKPGSGTKVTLQVPLER